MKHHVVFSIFFFLIFLRKTVPAGSETAYPQKNNISFLIIIVRHHEIWNGLLTYRRLVLSMFMRQMNLINCKLIFNYLIQTVMFFELETSVLLLFF